MLDLPYSTKKKRVNNLVVKAMDPSINLESAYTITQQPSNLAEKSCK